MLQDIKYTINEVITANTHVLFSINYISQWYKGYTNTSSVFAPQRLHQHQWCVCPTKATPTPVVCLPHKGYTNTSGVFAPQRLHQHQWCVCPTKATPTPVVCLPHKDYTNTSGVFAMPQTYNKTTPQKKFAPEFLDIGSIPVGLEHKK